MISGRKLKMSLDSPVKEPQSENHIDYFTPNQHIINGYRKVEIGFTKL